MNIEQALAAIAASSIDQAAAITEAIRGLQGTATAAEARVESLTTERDRLAENNASLLAEKGKANARARDLEGKLSELVKAYGEDGADEAAALDRLKNLTAELTTVKAERDAAIAEKGTAEEKMAELAAGLTYRDAAAKLGCEPIVLQKLLEIPADRIVLAEDGVKVKAAEGDAVQPFDDFLEAQPEATKKLAKLAIAGKAEDAPGPGPAPKGGGPKAPPTAPPPKAGDAKTYLEKAGFKGPVMPSKAATGA